MEDLLRKIRGRMVDFDEEDYITDTFPLSEVCFALSQCIKWDAATEEDREELKLKAQHLLDTMHPVKEIRL